MTHTALPTAGCILFNAVVKFFTWWLVSGNAFSAMKADAPFRRSFLLSPAQTRTLPRATQSMPSTTALNATSDATEQGHTFFCSERLRLQCVQRGHEHFDVLAQEAPASVDFHTVRGGTATLAEGLRWVREVGQFSITVAWMTCKAGLSRQDTLPSKANSTRNNMSLFASSADVDVVSAKHSAWFDGAYHVSTRDAPATRATESTPEETCAALPFPAFPLPLPLEFHLTSGCTASAFFLLPQLLSEGLHGLGAGDMLSNLLMSDSLRTSIPIWHNEPQRPRRALTRTGRRAVHRSVARVCP